MLPDQWNDARKCNKLGNVPNAIKLIPIWTNSQWAQVYNFLYDYSHDPKGLFFVTEHIDMGSASFVFVIVVSYRVLGTEYSIPLA